MSKAIPVLVLALAAGPVAPVAARPQTPPDETPPALAVPQAPPAAPGEAPKPPAPGDTPKPAPPAAARPSKESPKPELGQLANVKVDVTISDQRGSQPAITKTVSLTVADRGNGQIRSEGRVRVQKEGIYVVRLAVDLIRPMIEGNKVHTSLAVSYDTPAAEDTLGTTLGTDVRHSLTVVLENGKPLTIAESADPATDRRVTLQVKATILR